MIEAPGLALDAMAVTLEGRQLLAPITLQIPAGAWCGVVGPNGGGKSTLIKAIAGLVEHQGSIALQWPQNGPGRIGYMPQRVELDQSLPVTVSDYLRLHCQRRPVWLHTDYSDPVTALIETLGVNDFIDQRIGSLSMGQYQRLMLCTALSTQPQLLLLDEPMAGVDESGRDILLEVLQQYHRDGGSIVMVEHHWDVVQRYCDSVVWIDEGLVSTGTARKVLEALSERLSPFDLAPGVTTGSDPVTSRDNHIGPSD